MTMQQMNEYLEKRGFEVEREYDKYLGIYRFAIKKNGHVLTANFKYPETNDWRYRTELMQEFLEKIVREFEMRHCVVTDMNKDLYREVLERMRGYKPVYKPYADPMKIKDVIFNDPATIVFWADGTKTVVKCQEGDMFDPEKGLAMAIAKKVYGNKGHYFETVKKWCGPYYKKRANIQPWLDAIRDAIEKLKDRDI